MHATRNVFVLGLDGVPWRLVSEWVQAGHLPTFATLFEEGVAAPLESTTPATTPVAWPSITTGVRPDRHGVYSFYELTSEYRRRVNTGRDVDCPRLWDLLSPAVVGNVPLTYPARDVDGALVTGMMTPDDADEGSTHPPALATALRDRFPDYEVGLDWNEYHGRADALVDDLHDLLETRWALMNWLLDREEWRLAFFVFTGPDRLQHLVWDRAVLLEYYRLLDELLADVHQRVTAADGTLFVVSDHGFGPIDEFVHVNTALVDAGYVVPKAQSSGRSFLETVGVTKESVLGLLETAGVDAHTVTSVLPRRLVDSVASRVPGSHELYDVSYDETVAFVDAPGNVYVNDADRFADGCVDPADRESVTADLERLFSSLEHPETGDRLLDVADGRELFPRDERAPDLVVQGRPGYKVKTGLADALLTDPGAHAADHRPEGFFLAAGETVDSNGAVEDATVYDVAPTVLRAAGVAVPAFVDGSALTGLFGDDAAVTDAEMEPVSADLGDDGAVEDDDADFSSVEDRLRGLGYME